MWRFLSNLFPWTVLYGFLTIEATCRLTDTRNCSLVGSDQYSMLVKCNTIDLVCTCTARLQCLLHSRAQNMSVPFYPWCVRGVGSVGCLILRVCEPRL
jgi:hypothetical protein